MCLICERFEWQTRACRQKPQAIDKQDHSADRAKHRHDGNGSQGSRQGMKARYYLGCDRSSMMPKLGSGRNEEQVGQVSITFGGQDFGRQMT